MAAEIKTLRLAYITAGTGGMYCGSCMHDNTLARALQGIGVDVRLVPTYTPIHVEEPDVSEKVLFFGAINVYLDQKASWAGALPAWFQRLLDRPRLVRWATSRNVEISEKEVGSLTLAMLQGEKGLQKREVQRLCDWLKAWGQPQLVLFTNVLIAGGVEEIKDQLGVPVVVTLQGDDLFLDSLPEPYRSQALTRIRRLVRHVDGFLVHSRYYARLMASSFEIPEGKIHSIPLGLDTHDFQNAPLSPAPREPRWRAGRAPTVGYLARLAPEKGLHVLADAFIELRRRQGMETARLRVAGWLGERHRPYVARVFDKLRQAGLGDAFHYAGSVDRRGKVEFLRSLDVLSVPTTYGEPKGLFVLEALAAGVPVVQPQHGAFPEILAATGGGRLVRPEDPQHLAATLHELLMDDPTRIELGHRGRQSVHRSFNAEIMARAVRDVLAGFARV